MSKAESHRQRSQKADEERQKVVAEEVRAGVAQPKRAKFAEIALKATEEAWAIDPRVFLRTVGLMTKGHYAPAGNFHLSLMFGPLIFESGLPKYVLVRSCRSLKLRQCSSSNRTNETTQGQPWGLGLT